MRGGGHSACDGLLRRRVVCPTVSGPSHGRHATVAPATPCSPSTSATAAAASPHPRHHASSPLPHAHGPQCMGGGAHGVAWSRTEPHGAAWASPMRRRRGTWGSSMAALQPTSPDAPSSSSSSSLAPDHPPNGTSSAPYANGANGTSVSLGSAEYPTFVRLFRQVTCDRSLVYSVLGDIGLLHGLGAKVVVVTGQQDMIDDALRQRGMTPKWVGGYRMTDAETMKVAIEVAGELRTTCEQALSKGPAIPMIRRHTKGEGEIHFEPALNVVSGNYITAKRRGVVNGIDFGLTGEVRFVLKDAIKKQLEMGNIVLLSNLGFTAAGEVLNCSAFEVGLNAAIGLNADKLFCLHLDEVKDLGLPAWLPLSDAQEMLISKVQQGMLDTSDMDDFLSSLDSIDFDTMEMLTQQQQQQLQPRGPASRLPTRKPSRGGGALPPSVLSRPSKEVLVDLDTWNLSGLPTAISTCVIACCKGVKRAHLVDARLEGGLLLELYTRDGVGTMISADFYEGLRKARDSDVDNVQALLEPLEQAGVLVKRSRSELQDMMPDFIVIERETKLMGCAMLLPLGSTEDGISVAELGAFCVDPAFRGSGRGDSMLDYVEQEARNQGIRRLVLLTTRTADWFEQRDFQYVGPAFSSKLLPEARRAKINPARNSQLYVKQLEGYDSDIPMSKPGKRIGF